MIGLYTYKAEVVRVVDGDTVDLSVDLGFGIKVKERFRLYGINAPETRTRDLNEKKLGNAAKEYLIDRLDTVSDLQIRTKKDTKGKFGRYLCTLLGEYDENINLEMIELGYAEEYMK